MTPLARRLIRQIATTGPIRLSDFMAACLTDPVDGYYTTRDPLGAQGDFTTAPEVSQMFGEMIGLWLAQTWVDAGRPAPFVLAELGPGRGTLMTDVLRAARIVPDLVDAAQIWLVEASPALRARQAELLPTAQWADTVADLPPGPLLCIANEFFDALPIRQHQRTETGWAERMVGVSGRALVFGLAPATPDPELDRRFGDAAPGTIIETCPMAEALVQILAGRHATLLAVDYGAWDGTGDTLQAVQNHGYADLLATPGTTDLTAHVGFRWLAEAGRPLIPHFTTQGAFLERLGVTPRARTLAVADPDTIRTQHRRLTHPEEMGTLFKVLALTPATQPLPPGFAP